MTDLTPITAIQAAANDALARARAYTVVAVSDAASLARAAEVLTAANGAKTAADNHRKAVKAPYLDATRAIDGAFKPAIEYLDNVIDQIKRNVASYHRAEETARRERERQADEERQAALQLAIEAAEAGNIAGAEEMQRALAATPPLQVPQAQMPAGLAKTERWRAEVRDFRALVMAAAANPEAYLALLLPNDQALNNMARQRRGTMNVPGVFAVSETGISARRG